MSKKKEQNTTSSSSLSDGSESLIKEIETKATEKVDLALARVAEESALPPAISFKKPDSAVNSVLPDNLLSIKEAFLPKEDTTEENEEAIPSLQSPKSSKKPATKSKIKRPGVKKAKSPAKSILSEEKQIIKKVMQETKEISNNQSSEDSAPTKTKQPKTIMTPDELDRSYDSISGFMDAAWELFSTGTDSMNSLFEVCNDAAEDLLADCVKVSRKMCKMENPVDTLLIQEEFVREQSDKVLSCVSKIIQSSGKCCKDIESRQDKLSKACEKAIEESLPG